MSESKPQLGIKKEAAILALLTHRNIAEAARAVGISERTLFRWLQDPDFQAAYREARQTTYLQSMARLQQMSSVAVATLGVIMLDANAPAASRLRAADAVLNHAGKSLEKEDVLVRLADVERRLARRRK
jgi:hypothetical protein